MWVKSKRPEVVTESSELHVLKLWNPVRHRSVVLSKLQLIEGTRENLKFATMMVRYCFVFVLFNLVSYSPLFASNFSQEDGYTLREFIQNLMKCRGVPGKKTFFFTACKLQA